MKCLFFIDRGLHATVEHHGAVPERHFPRVSSGKLGQTLQTQNSGIARKRSEHLAKVHVQIDVSGETGSGPERDFRVAGSYWFANQVIAPGLCFQFHWKQKAVKHSNETLFLLKIY